MKEKVQKQIVVVSILFYFLLCIYFDSTGVMLNMK